MSRIPKAFIQSFPNLKVLSLSKTDLEELPSCIGKLANLVTLIVSDNSKLRRIPAASIAPLTKLAHFDFSYCSSEMSYFPMDALSKLKNLSFLNGWIKFGGRLNMSSWPKMTHLDIRCSPESKSALSLVGIAKADALKILRVDHPLIKVKDPSSFKELVKLEEVSLHGLCQQPTWEWGQNLKRLHLHLAVASEETTAQGLHVVPTVEELDLRKIHISKPFSHEFSNLEELQLFQCFGIMRFSNLPRLRSLSINSCDEVEDMAVHSCPALRFLNITKMRKLHKLELVSPESCGSLNQSLPNLKRLELDGCPALSTVMPEQVTDGHDRLENLSLIGARGERGSFLPILQQEQAPGYNAKFPALARMSIGDSKEGVPWLPGLGNFLKTLDLECSGKGMDMFDERWLSTLSNLDRLSIWRLGSESVPGWVATLPRLRTLDLDNCSHLKGNWLPAASQNGDSYYSSLEFIEIARDIDTASLMPPLQALVRKREF